MRKLRNKSIRITPRMYETIRVLAKDKNTLEFLEQHFEQIRQDKMPWLDQEPPALAQH